MQNDNIDSDIIDQNFITLCRVLKNHELKLRGDSLTETDYVSDFGKYRIIQIFDTTPIQQDFLEFLEFNNFIHEENDNKYIVLEYIEDIDLFKNDINTMLVSSEELQQYTSPFFIESLCEKLKISETELFDGNMVLLIE